MKTSARRSRFDCMAVLVGLVVQFVAASAFAQVIEEVTVTAQRRAENVQNVPIAITAVTSEMLQAKGITDVAKLTNIAPNVTLDPGTPFSGSDTVLAAYIRGIGQNDFAFNLDPGVGVYVDGVYLARSVGANTTMLDVERVEILKGPQGTLFGRNSIGGAISIVTHDPGSEFSFRGNVTGGDFHRLDVQASIDLPISDKIRSSIAFGSQKRDGFQKRVAFTDLANKDGADPSLLNPLATIPDCGPVGTPCAFVTDDSSRFPAAGTRTSDREGGINQWNVRGKMVFLFTDNVRFTLAADYTNVDQSASAATVADINPSQLAGLYNLCLVGAPLGVLCTEPRGGLSPTPTQMAVLPPLSGVNVDGDPNNNRLPYDNRFESDDIDTSFATGNSFSKLENWGVAGTLDWSFSDAAKLKSITAYRDMQWDSGMDLDGSPLTIDEPSFDMPQRQVSEELQLNGLIFGERLNYVVGAYYFHEEGNLHDWVIFPGGLLMIDGPNDLETTAKALYAHLNFKVTDNFGITVGGRYTDETKHFEGHQTDDNGLTYKISGCNPPGASAALIGAPPTLTCQQALTFPSAAEPYRYFPPGERTLDFSNTSPTVGLDFHFTDDMMLYASYSKGYRTGGWTTRLSSPHPTYDDELHFGPEHATAEEIGFKSEFLDRRLRLNLAAFHTTYDDIQLNSQIGISPTVVNAGDARIYGFEAEAEAVFGGLSFNTSFGYTDAKYTRMNNVGDNGQPLTLDSCPARTSDPNDACDLPKTPEWKFYAGPQYVFSLGNGSAIQLNADWTHTDDFFNDLGNNEDLKREATDVVNASLTYRAPGDQWEFVVGGTNLTDDRYIVTGQLQGGTIRMTKSYSRPREWFATLRFKTK
jgi:iron complex outermembrane recepter protein